MLPPCIALIAGTASPVQGEVSRPKAVTEGMFPKCNALQASTGYWEADCSDPEALTLKTS